MILSVGYNFDETLIDSLSKLREVKEIYGKMSNDYIGGGRSSYTLNCVGYKQLLNSVKKAHLSGLEFNYLLNAASLYGVEQTRTGQRQIRAALDRLSDTKVDTITVASPYLLRLIKYQYPQFKVKIGAFAVIDNALKARYWQEMGADELCISAIACNRNFKLLKAIRSAVSCECILIANASCMQSCPFELTHMHLLSNSSRQNDPLKGFCFDYCFLHCSHKKLLDPVNYVRSIWIRPEDLHIYEEMGYSKFKLVERSSPSDLILKRAKAYSERSFDGNLLEIVGPVALIKKELHTPLFQRIRMLTTMFKPSKMKISSLFQMKKYAEQIILHDYSKANAGVYIDNKSMDGFLYGLRKRSCSYTCSECGYCGSFAKKSVKFNDAYRDSVLKSAEMLDLGLLNGELWD